MAGVKRNLGHQIHNKQLKTKNGVQLSSLVYQSYRFESPLTGGNDDDLRATCISPEIQS